MYEELQNLSLKEIVGLAIFSEEEAAKFYRNIIKDINPETLVAHRFEGLAKDEDMHKWVMMDFYRELYGEDNYTVPEGIPPFETSGEVKTVDNLIGVLEAAMINEDNAFKVYKFLAHNHKDHRKLFKYLSHYEHGHYDVLKREKEHFEEMVIDEPGNRHRLLIELPHDKEFGFRVLGTNPSSQII